MDIRTTFLVYVSKNLMELVKNGSSEVYLKETGLHCTSNRLRAHFSNNYS